MSQKAIQLRIDEGKSLIPYDCGSYASYQINLEILESTTLIKCK